MIKDLIRRGLGGGAVLDLSAEGVRGWPPPEPESAPESDLAAAEPESAPESDLAPPVDPGPGPLPADPDLGSDSGSDPRPGSTPEEPAP